MRVSASMGGRRRIGAGKLVVVRTIVTAAIKRPRNNGHKTNDGRSGTTHVRPIWAMSSCFVPHANRNWVWVLGVGHISWLTSRHHQGHPVVQRPHSGVLRSLAFCGRLTLLLSTPKSF